MATDITKFLIESLIRETAAGGRREVIDRTQGLILRVGARGAAWTWKHVLNRKTLRLTIGPWPEWSIAEARDVAAAATSLLRAKRGIPNEAWLQAERVRLGKADAGAAEAATPATIRAWDFATAREHYLDWVKQKRAEATWRDRRYILHGPDLAPFEGRRVGTITRQEFAGVLARIHERGAERHAEHVAETLRPMWTYLADDSRIGETGVEVGIMERLKAPERSRRVGAMGQIEIGRGQYVPPPEELARIVAICDAGVMSDDMSVAIAMLVFLGQRRRMVASAVIEDFEDLGERGALWWIPAAHRKTALTRGLYSAHVVPVPPTIWARIQPQIKSALERQPSDEERDANAPPPEPVKPGRGRHKRVPPQIGVRQSKHLHWLFPGARPRKWGEEVTHIHVDDLTHRIRELPDVLASAHELRNGFATHGEAILGFSRAQTRMILDHSEGGESQDVTARYALHRGMHAKWPIMQAWCEFLDAALPKAKAELPSETDLRALIKKARAEAATGKTPLAAPVPAPVAKKVRAKKA
ncbi:MAG: hypothetical protein DI565_02460 [Ancylobacter novellus]|uniref:Integrase DNA-binding domain-containing protein n=1 Tax=Ancylobacter novellus TaxID=921 RepID=A0A2W5KQ87_ANCNO|nr:MAG: hypothetical protein DI565_02460 [Ancylobacter novellus]